MIYSLDTNVCIRYLNGRSALIRQKLPTVPAHEIIVCSVVRGELAYGAAKSQTPVASKAKHQRFLDPYGTLPFDDSAAAEFGCIRASLGLFHRNNYAVSDRKRNNTNKPFG
jgi:tRNA(fMet)-specific endonuclease VapC